MTGIMLAPQLPLEEAFFLAFLCYQTMILFTGALASGAPAPARIRPPRRRARQLRPGSTTAAPGQGARHELPGAERGVPRARGRRGAGGAAGPAGAPLSRVAAAGRPVAVLWC